MRHLSLLVGGASPLRAWSRESLAHLSSLRKLEGLIMMSIKVKDQIWIRLKVKRRIRIRF
jgi:hypothetical protein